MNSWTNFKDLPSGVPQTIGDTNYKTAQNVSLGGRLEPQFNYNKKLLKVTIDDAQIKLNEFQFISFEIASSSNF